MKAKTFTRDIFKNLMQRLNNDRKGSGKYCDVKVLAGGYNFPVHKCILGLLSDFYGNVFFGQLKKENSENQVKKDTMERILDFIYTGKLIITSENVYDLVKAAHFMEIPHIKECCVAFLDSEINPDNCLQIRSYIKNYGYSSLVEKIDNIIGKNLNSLITRDDFKNMDANGIETLFKYLKNKQITSAETSYQALIGWIKHDVSARDQNTAHFMSLIDFTKLSWTFLNRVVATEPLIEISHECTKMLLQAMRCHSDPQATVEIPRFQTLPKQHLRSNSDEKAAIAIAHKRSSSSGNLQADVVPVPRQRGTRNAPPVPPSKPPPIPTKKPPPIPTQTPPTASTNKSPLSLPSRPPIVLPKNLSTFLTKTPPAVPPNKHSAPIQRSPGIPKEPRSPPIIKPKRTHTNLNPEESSSSNVPLQKDLGVTEASSSYTSRDTDDGSCNILSKPRAVCKPRRNINKDFDEKPGGFTFFKGDKAWKFDVPTGRLTALPNLKYNHGNGSMIRLEEEVYVISGKWTDKVEKLNLLSPQTEWIEISSTLHRRCLAAAVIWEETVCVFGGRPFNPTAAFSFESASLSLNEAYNPVEGAWFGSKEKTDGSYDHAVLSIGDSLYSVGGEKSNTLKCFDPNDGQWQALSPMSTYRGGLAAVVLDDEIYAIGGRDEHGKNSSSVEKYNLKSKHWVNVAGLNVARSRHRACVVDGMIYVIGGNTSAIEIFDPTEGKWNVAAEIEEFYQIDSLAAF